MSNAMTCKVGAILSAYEVFRECVEVGTLCMCAAYLYCSNTDCSKLGNPCELKVEAEALSDLSEKYEVAVVPCFVFIKVCFSVPLTHITVIIFYFHPSV